MFKEPFKFKLIEIYKPNQKEFVYIDKKNTDSGLQCDKPNRGLNYF